MAIKYFLFHGTIHLALVALIYFIFQLNLFNLFLAFFASVLIDVDHLKFIKKKGLYSWMKIWSSHTAKKYPLHNFVTLIVFSLGSLLIFHPYYFSVAICSISIALHLVWDFFEDVAIFKLGIKHWRACKWI